MTRTTTAAESARARRALLSAAGEARDALDLFAEASARLRRLVPHVAAVWRTTDPMTGLMTSPIRVENLDHDGCSTFWASEFLAENVNPFHEVARMSTPAVGLRETTGNLPARSALYREYLRPRGLDDELRAVLRAGGHPWGTVSLFRGQGQLPFTPADIELLAGLSAPLGDRLRRFARAPLTADRVPGTGPGLLSFALDGTLTSANDEAMAHLARIPAGPDAVRDPPLPAWMHGMVLRARAVAEGRERGPARLRVRGHGGAWFLCHASSLTGSGGSGSGQIVLMIDLAGAGEMAPILCAAYDLSPREVEITQHVAAGLSTVQIAGEVFLSPHTVRDHIKTIFDKTRVASRGELVAKLFTECYEPLAAEQVVRIAR